MDDESCFRFLESFHKNLSRRFCLSECHIRLIYYTVMSDSHTESLSALCMSSSYYYKVFDKVKILLGLPPFSRASDLAVFYFAEFFLFVFENTLGSIPLIFF